MQKVITNIKNYTLYTVAGRVAESSKNMETIVRGTGGGYNNSGYSTPVSISSKTIIHDAIFLIDDIGMEHSIQLRDFNVACRQGNYIKVIWAVKNGKKSGEYIVVTNKTTGRTYFNTFALRRIFKPRLIYPLIITFILIVYNFNSTTIFLGFLMWMAFVIYTVKRADAFKKRFNPDLVN